MFKSIYKDGYSWVEIPDDEWDRAMFSTFYQGIDVT
jgi:hypothetical protein